MDPSPDIDPIGAVRALVDRGAVDLLTCDVFDTLVWRPVARPHDLFVSLGRQLSATGRLPSFVDAIDFTEGRRQAERRARELNRRSGGESECTLEDIWAQMPSSWHARSAAGAEVGVDRWRRAGLQAELDLEGDVLHVHQQVAELLEHAHAAGVTTALVSDTYFSEERLRALLTRADAPLGAIDHVVVSCERGRGKFQGLLAELIAELGAVPQRVVHLGDNPIADVRAAQEAGATAVRSVVDTDEMAAPAVLGTIATCSALHGTDGAVSGVVNELLFHPSLRARPDAELGVSLGGPLLYGFSSWASRQAEAFAVDTIHCLLREGQLIAEAIEVARPDGPSPRLVHASRWTALRAAVIDGTADELFRALARGAEFHPEHVTEAFGVDRRLVGDVLGDRPMSDHERAEAMVRIADHDELREAIVASSSQVRARVLRYLDTVLRPTDGRLVLCDIGWGGTIQEGLDAILRHEGRLAPDDELIGLYLSLSAPGRARVGGGARMLGYLPTDAAHRRAQEVLQRTPEIPEQLCTPEVGTLLDFAEDGAPITAPQDPTWTASRSRAQSAMRRTVAALAAAEPSETARRLGESVWDSAEMRSALLLALASTLESPTRPLAETLTGWLHDDVAGGVVVPLARTDELTFLPFLSAAEIDRVSMRDVFWLPGAAASANPPLAAQLTAAARGVDVDALCPASDAGRATIAVYAPGSDHAVAVDHPIPRLDARGWSLLRLRTSTTAVRDVRIDFGDVDHLVELDHLTIRFARGAGEQSVGSTWRIDRLDDRRLRWDGARVIGARRAAVRAGGHLVVSVTGRAEADSHTVDIECAFRVVALTDADASLLPSPTRVRATKAARRAGDAARRRGEALVASARRGPRRDRSPATTTPRPPSFSIVLPIYDSPREHLEEQLAAIRSQTYPRWECVVVDDGSPDDGPRRLAQRFADADDRFVVLTRPVNGGIAAATNDGLERASEDWIVFVDHDDVIHADALARIAEHIGGHPDDELVYTDERTVDERGEELYEYRKPDYSPERLLGHNYLCHIVAVRRSLLDRTGRLDPSCEPSADRDFNLRATELARGVGHVPEVLYSWRAVPGSVATSLDAKSDVGGSVVTGAERALARRGEVAAVQSVESDRSCVRIIRPPVDATVQRIEVGELTSPLEIDRQLAASVADVVVLHPADALDDDQQGYAQLVALCRRGNPVVGPRLVSSDGRLVSAGRTHRPRLADPLQGIGTDESGPWAAFLVTREVASVSPLGAVLDRRAVGDLGGLDLVALLATAGVPASRLRAVSDDDRADLSLAMAVLCAVARAAGHPALWSPLATVTLPTTHLRAADDQRASAARLERMVALWPALADDPFWPATSTTGERAPAAPSTAGSSR